MKPIYCKNCGDEIQSGYAVNPANSALCETCYNEAVVESDLVNE